MKKQYLNELSVNIGIFVVLAVFASQVSKITADARAIPLAYIIACSAMNLVLFIINFVKYRKSEAGTDEKNRPVIVAVLIYILIMGLYVFSMKYISYILSTYLFILGSLLFLKTRNKWTLIILPVVLTLALYFLFTRCLFVFPPSGTLIKIKWY